MKVKIKRLNKSAPLPQYQTPGSAGFDLECAADLTIPPNGLAVVPTNLIIEIPTGYMLLIVARSSLAGKKGLTLPNGIGIIDSDYRGPKDIIKISVYNFTNQLVEVNKGERLAQGIFVKVEQATWQETEEVTATSRGGFGSTG